MFLQLIGPSKLLYVGQIVSTIQLFECVYEFAGCLFSVMTRIISRIGYLRFLCRQITQIIGSLLYSIAEVKAQVTLSTQ